MDEGDPGADRARDEVAGCFREEVDGVLHRLFREEEAADAAEDDG